MRRAPTAAQKEAARAKRAELSARCMPLHLARKSGRLPWSEFPTINDCLLYIYGQETGQTQWNTFKNWRDAGAPVRKGEKGFAIWGRPIGATSSDPEPEQMAEGEESGESPGKTFYPIAYLFHAGQVDRHFGNTPAESQPAQQPEPETAETFELF